MLLGRPVGEVEPEDVNPRLEELAQDLGLAAGGPDRGDDLGATGVVRGCAARRNPIRSGGRHQLCPVVRVCGTGVGAAGIGAVTGPVGASSGLGGLSSSCSMIGIRQTMLASTRPAAAESSARKSWPPPIRVRSKKSRTGCTARTSA